MIVKQNKKLCEACEEYFFKIVQGGDALCDKNWQAKEISPPYTRLYYTVEGVGEIETEEGKRLLEAGKLYVIPAGYTFSYRCEDSMRQLYFHVILSDLSGNDLLRGINKVLSLETDAEHLLELLSLYHDDGVSLKLLKARIQTDLFTALKAENVTLSAKETSECVKKALAYIGDNLSASLTVSEVAKNIFVSTDTLSRRFKKEMGESVGKYIDGLILYRAEQLLSGSDLSLSQISAELGFYDQFYFSRRFKEKFSVSPLKYRKTYRPQK